MFEALLIGAVLVAALACPVMMWLGRRGIGPGCAFMGACEQKGASESLDDLQRRQRELAARIAELEPAETGPPSPRSQPS